MRDVGTGVAETVTGFVAGLTGHPATDLPEPAAAGDDWLGVLRQWLARQSCGLVSIANPGAFSWPGHWIGIVESPDREGEHVGVLLFGTPSAVIASPAAPTLMGSAVEDLDFLQGLMLVPIDPFMRAEPDRDRTTGEVAGIYITESKTAPMRAMRSATAIPGTGLEGDRYAKGAGTFTPISKRLRGYDITLIESEVLEALRLAGGTRLAPEESRRNVVTRGIDLNALVGSELRIGDVRLFGQRLCEPCAHLQRLTHPGVVAGLVHRGGLRADILSGGEIHVGDRVQAVR